MKNFQYFFAFVIGFFLNCYAASAMENEETLRESALSALHENKLTFTDNKGMNYTLQPTVPPDNFKSTITEGWHLSLIHSGGSTSSSHSTSTTATNRSAPNVSEVASRPQHSTGEAYFIYDKNKLDKIGTLLEYSAGSDASTVTQSMLSGAQGLKTGAKFALTSEQREKMLRDAEALEQAARSGQFHS